MNNNNKSKDKNEFREEIERIRQSGGVIPVRDTGISFTFLFTM
ncbi:hypothetical protein [Wolbachia endosymbiont of Oedothorax gibbosus]|nr:hypothetical protein [Wolbachia endosymbiont of Oedothorax gibbosus]MDX5462036.1 hypothetical protein [Wolbachia endosymbiont of Tetragnatha montana]